MEVAGGVVFVAVVEELAGDFATQQAGFVAVQDRERGVESDEMKMPAEQSGAEAVQRADAGVIDQVELRSRRAEGRSAGTLANGGVDAQLHLGGGGFSEGDDQQIVHVAGFGGIANQMAQRAASIAVLPEPAAAETRRLRPVVVMPSCWAGVGLKLIATPLPPATASLIRPKASSREMGLR